MSNTVQQRWLVCGGRNFGHLSEEMKLIIAFPGGRGTANMIALAKEASVETIEVKYP